MKKLSITISGHRTSITLEDEFADVLRQIAKRENTSIAKIIQNIDANGAANLSSAVRVWVLKRIMSQIPE